LAASARLTRSFSVTSRAEEPYPWIAPDHAAGLAGDLMIDCAVYGKRNNARDVDGPGRSRRRPTSSAASRRLISRNHHTRERFWQVYDRERWAAARQELDPHGCSGTCTTSFIRRPDR